MVVEILKLKVGEIPNCTSRGFHVTENSLGDVCAQFVSDAFWEKVSWKIQTQKGGGADATDVRHQ